MEKNNFDKFVSEKLGQREFQFNPAHWEAAEKLIDLQEVSNNRRRRTGWWLLLIPLLALLAYWCLYGKQASTASITQSGLINTAFSQSNNSDDLKTLNTIQTNSLKGDQTNEQKTNPTLTTTTTTTTSTLNDESTQAELSTIEENNTAPQPILQNTAKSSSVKTENEQTNKTSATITTTTASPDASTTVSKGPTISNTIDDNPSGILLSPDTTRNIKQNRTSLPQAANITPAGSEQDERPSVLATGEAVVMSNKMMNLTALDASLEELASEEKGALVKPAPTKKFDVGLTAGALFYSTEIKDLVEGDSTGSTFLSKNSKVGFTGGLTFRYRLNPYISLHADALYQWRKESFGTVDSYEEEAYSFGRVEKTSEVKPKSFHSVELPIYAQYNMSRHSIEAGATFRYLLAIKGVKNLTEQAQLSSGQADEMSNVAQVWVSEDNYDRFTMSYLVGYRYWVNPRLNIGLRATYTPSATPFDNSQRQEGSDVSYIPQTSSLNFNLSAKWYFK